MNTVGRNQNLNRNSFLTNLYDTDYKNIDVIEELKFRGATIEQTKSFFIGIHHTLAGDVPSNYKDVCKERVYYLKVNGKLIPTWDKVTFLINGTEYTGKVKSVEQAKQLAKEGKIYSYRCSDLYAEYYNFAKNKELASCFYYGYSVRSREYIKEVADSIGFIRYVDTEEGFGYDSEILNFKPIEIYDILPNCMTYIGKVDNEYVAQSTYMDMDMSIVNKMFFNRMPTEDDVKIAFTILEFVQNPFNEVFYCCGCGRTIHWTNLKGDIIQKYKMSKDHYCGCI